MIGCVILNFNDASRCLTLAENLSSFKIIGIIYIVDNCSNDDSMSFLEKNVRNKKIKFIKSEFNGGFAYGTNVGIKEIIKHHEYISSILCINSDIIVSETLIEKLDRKLMSTPNLGLISARMRGIHNEEQLSWWNNYSFKENLLSNFYFYAKKKYRNQINYKYSSDFMFVDCVRGSLMLFKKNALVDVGLFDEKTFLYGEETIISCKLRSSKYKIGLITSDYYIHNHIEKNSSLVKTKIMMNKSKNYYLKTYFKYSNYKLLILKIFSIYSYIEFATISFIKSILKNK